MSALQIIAGPLGEIKAATVDGRSSAYTSAGHPLTAAATGIKHIQLPIGTRYCRLIPRNFSTAVSIRWAIDPYLLILKTVDNFATAPTDASETLQDADNSTTLALNSLDVKANGDMLLIGSHIPFAGVSVNVVNTNSAGTAAMGVEYWNGAWGSITPTDGTFSTRTLAQDGNVTWTVPTDWVAASLRTIQGIAAGVNCPYSGQNLYWTRWSVDTLLADSSVSVANMLALSRNAAVYAEMTSTDFVDFTLERGPGGAGCIEAVTDAGTANLIVNVATAFGGDGRFRS